MGIHCSLSMLGSAVSSSTPKDFQPNSHMGVLASRPLMNRHAWPAPSGLAYIAVGMQRASDSGIGLPSRSTSASWMLVFLMPAEVRRNLMLPPGVIPAGENAPEPRQPSLVKGSFPNTGPVRRSLAFGRVSGPPSVDRLHRDERRAHPRGSD